MGVHRVHALAACLLKSSRTRWHPLRSVGRSLLTAHFSTDAIGAPSDDVTNSQPRESATQSTISSAKGSASVVGGDARVRDSTTFWGLGAPSSVTERLRSQGIVTPTPIQVKAFEAFKTGRHVIMSAETGSGKTLAYLLPSLRVPEWFREAYKEASIKTTDEAEAAGDARDNAGTSTDAHTRDRKPGLRYPSVLVLVPSMDLAYQVARMSISAGISAIVARKDSLYFERSEHPWAVSPVHKERLEALKEGDSARPRGLAIPAPYICVGTPAGLWNSRDTFHNVFPQIHTVVVDESDALMDDGAVKTTELVLTAIRNVHARRTEESVRLERSQKLKARKVSMNTSNGGGGKHDTTASDAPIESHDVAAQPKDASVEARVRELPETACAANDARSVDDVARYPPKPATSDTGAVQFLSQRIVFVGATLPSKTSGSVGQWILRRYPHAVRIDTPATHHVVDRIQQKFVRLESEEEKMPAVENLLLSELGFRKYSTGGRKSASPSRRNKDDSISANGESALSPRALIFVRTTERAILTHDALAASGFRVRAYHADMKLEERVASLDALREGSVDMLVCTDGAARGLDLPVDHVVQLDFALSAVSYIHRCGRTGRAGRGGSVVNFLAPTDYDLADAIAVRGKQSLDTAFSRNRNFRRQLKRHVAKASK